MTVCHHRCSVGGERLLCDRTMCIWETWAALGGDPGVKDYLDCAPEVLGLNCAIGVAVQAVTSLVMVGPDCGRLSVGTQTVLDANGPAPFTHTRTYVLPTYTHSSPQAHGEEADSVVTGVHEDAGGSFCRRDEMRGIYLHTRSSMSLELSCLYRGPQGRRVCSSEERCQ